MVMHTYRKLNRLGIAVFGKPLLFAYNADFGDVVGFVVRITILLRSTCAGRGTTIPTATSVPCVTATIPRWQGLDDGGCEGSKFRRETCHGVDEVGPCKPWLLLAE